MSPVRLFEFEDQAWLPRPIRDAGTDYIRFMAEVGDVYRPIVPKLKDALSKTGSDHILDLCSGGVGPVVSIQRSLAAAGCAIRVTLSDKFPNLPAFEHAGKRSRGTVDYVEEPVDATAVPHDLPGFRTFFSSMHHFPAEMVHRILKDAVEQGRPIGAFDMSAHRPPPLPMLLMANPLVLMASTPFLRPFRWSRLFWTYLVPAAPLYISWDAFVSGLRLYSIEELEDIVSGLPSNSYRWEIGSTPFPRPITYLIGYP